MMISIQIEVIGNVADGTPPPEYNVSRVPCIGEYIAIGDILHFVRGICHFVDVDPLESSVARVQVSPR